ncbi:MAG: hypothetical protein KF715_09730 [Candidatus Didemnitutus sp.]|nr:hypothetical protein [Candidatus Didemnitutus sp.]
MFAVWSLLASGIDYAGLFPPAKLGMPDTVQRHADYLTGPHRALLGAFVLSLDRLAEFETAHASLAPAAQTGWRLNVLASADPAADAATITAFNARHAARIVAVETKAATPAEVARVVAPFDSSLDVWVELPATAADLPALINAVRTTGRGAKLRTGGVTANAFPSPADVARFLRECHRAGVVMKATAGLHHPLRGDYALTYEPGSPRGAMFGFLNILLAAALIRAGGSDSDTLALLDERDAHAFILDAETITWRGSRFTAPQLAATRQALCRSFGSCSFTEPIAGLQALSWL